MGIEIHYTIVCKGNIDSLSMMLERAIDQFKKIGNLKISAIMDTGVVKLKGDWLTIEENESIVQKLAMQGSISPTQAAFFFYVQQEKAVKQFQLVGFSSLFTDDCAGTEPFNLGFVNNFKSKSNVWRVHGSTKTEWANDFIKAHVQVIKMIKIMNCLGCQVVVDDEAGYWGEENLDTLKESKRQSESAMKVFESLMKKQGMIFINLNKQPGNNETGN
jgi:hypothetical protein